MATTVCRIKNHFRLQSHIVANFPVILQIGIMNDATAALFNFIGSLAVDGWKLVAFMGFQEPEGKTMNDVFVFIAPICNISFFT